MRLVNIGFGNALNVDRIVCVISPDAAPTKRMIQDGKEKGTLIDATAGRKTKSVIITDSDNLILTYLSCEAVTEKINGSTEE